MKNIKIDKNLLKKSFTDIINICLLIFLIQDFKKLIMNIKEIKLKSLNFNENNNALNKKQLKNKNNDVSITYTNKLKKNKNGKQHKKFINHIISDIHSPPNKKKYKKNKNKNNFNANKISVSKKTMFNLNTSKMKSNLDFLDNKKEIELKQEIIALNYKELNSLNLEEAIIKDKRNFIQYYTSLLKIKHIILFIFNKQDYNSKFIKISIFIFNLATYIMVNALFFNDSTMHKIYTDQGSFNFIYQLPQIICSSLISGILNALIKLLGLSESIIIKFKNNKINMNERINKLITTLKIKFSLFYIINFILLILFWYYITCFCGIYKNTQIHLIEDSLLSFALTLITPFGMYLLVGIFRLTAIKRKSKCLYGFSKILQLL